MTGAVRSVHLLGERKLLGIRRLHETRRGIVDEGKTRKLGWNDPLSLPRKSWRSLQARATRETVSSYAEKEERKENHVDHQQTTGDGKTRV
jgi:hypothetical protein